MSTETGAQAARDQRRDAILAAAREAFVHYGFRRTSLEEIASSAGISRTGLYHHFASKEEIFRAVSEDLHRRALEAAVTGAAQQGSTEERLLAVLEAKLGFFFDLLASSRHGEELTDESNRLCGDHIAAQAERYEELLAGVLHEAARGGDVDLRSAGLGAGAAAALLHLSASGLKGSRASPPPPAEHRRRLRELVHLFVRGLRARS